MLSGHYFRFAKFGIKWFDSSALNAEVVFAEITEEGRSFHSFIVLGKNEFA